MNRNFIKRLKESLGFDVLKSFLTVIIIVLSVHTFIFILFEYNHLKESLRNEGETLTDILSYNSRLGVFSENIEILKDEASGISNRKDILSVTIYRADLKALYTANNKSYKKHIEFGQGTINKKTAANLTTSQSLEVKETRNTIEFIKPVVIESSPLKEALYFGSKDIVKTEKIIGYTRIVLDKTAFHNQILYILLNNALMLLILVISSVVIIYHAIKKSFLPLEKLSDHIKKIGMGERPEKFSIESKDEISRLAATFNEMSENLRKREEEKKLLEENLAQAKKMEAVGTLARGIAHDFNNILGIIKGAMYVLKKNIRDDKVFRNYSIVIDNSIKRAKDLVEALLVFSRTATAYLVSFDVNTLIRETENEILSEIHENIKYSATFADIPLIIKADKLKIKQVIANIIINASDVIPESGGIYLKTETVHISAEDTRKGSVRMPGDYACIAISDTGAGMDEKTKERIFEPFFTTKEVGKGAGLGLSIVYGIIEEQKGYIDVETAEGEGTTFKIYLPLSG